MRNGWFTSDTHFGHKNIIKYCDRPFSGVEEMDAEMIRRWNAVVKPDDIVFHLGDVGVWWGKERMLEVIRCVEQLNGEIHLIQGNHDKKPIANIDFWASFQTVEREHRLVFNDGRLPLTLTHAPIKDWSIAKGWNLHGHTHGSQLDSFGQIDVGVDCWEYTPVSLEDIQIRMQNIEMDCHHNRVRR